MNGILWNLFYISLMYVLIFGVSITFLLFIFDSFTLNPRALKDLFLFICFCVGCSNVL